MRVESVTEHPGVNDKTNDPDESRPPASPASISRDVRIQNKYGLHARPAMQFVDVANRFQSTVTVHKGSQSVNGKSIMEMMLLAATKGTVLRVEAFGEDAEDMLDALAELVDRKFDENDE